MITYEKMDVIKAAELQCIASGVELKDYTEEEKERGSKLLEKCINEIKAEIPSLIPVFNILKLFPVKLPIEMSTDFTRLFFNPKVLISKRKEDQYKDIKFQLMHIILHGLLGDNDIAAKEKKSKVLWLALDQRVDDICLKLGVTPSYGHALKDTIEYMKNNKPYSISFGNYYLSKKNKYLKRKASAAYESIACDNHEFWYPVYVKKMLGIIALGGEDAIGGDENGEKLGGTSGEWEQVRKLFMEGAEPSENSEIKKGQELLNSLKNDMTSKNAGIGKGCGTGFIEEAEGKPMDYKDLIRDFLHNIEDPREIPDSIDPMMYQFGLDTYGDVPLIEPREGDEILKLNTLCLAIDTSGSCGGDVARRFLRETKELIRELKETQVYGKLLLIQCDYEIQKQTMYEIDDFLNEESEEISEFLGWGGTSFVPVFDRLEELAKEEDNKIDGLIYLSDGYGSFPDTKPDYPTFFVMPKEDAQNNNWVPKWVEIGVIE